MSDLYQEWGFSGSPFRTTPLQADDTGKRLLVGRDEDLRRLRRRLASSGGKLPTLEGLNGVGKTSIVNVATYELLEEHQADQSKPIYLPCGSNFQLRPDEDLDRFVDSVLMAVAQTIISAREFFDNAGIKLDLDGIDSWLNAAQVRGYQGTVGFLGGGVQQETNTSAGFERSGFRAGVRNLLEHCFPADGWGNVRGGVVCVVDNLELLQTSEAARAMVEQLRDELLHVQGLRWVLCGALGIVHGIAASPRLEGYLAAPLEIGEIDRQHALRVLQSRIEVFSRAGGVAYLPIVDEDFLRLYDLMRGNLRATLGYMEDYCQSVADYPLPNEDGEKRSVFDAWLRGIASDVHDAVQAELTPRAVTVFKAALAMGVAFSPSSYADFGFANIQAFRPHIKALEGVSVLVSTKDDSDQRRKTIQITPKGLFLGYYYDRVAPAAED